VVGAVQAQLERFSHTSAQVAIYEPYVRLAERLNALAPGAGPKKTLLLTTGVEAVENAVKIARAATGRSAIVAFSGSFHGRTLLGMSLTGKTSPYQQNFGPFAPDVFHAPFPYPLRGWSEEDALRALDDVFASQVAPERVAAVLIEPVLGEGGFVPAPPSFLRALRALTERHGMLLIVDEIQSGFGRTGRLFAVEHSGVVPDLVTVAKSLAGGLPLSAVIGRADVMDAPDPGGLGGTYGGNPLACAAALAVLDVFEQTDLLERADKLGAALFERLEALQAEHDVIAEVRGLGAMVAAELIAPGEGGVGRGAALTERVIAEARRRGLLLLKAGRDGNVLRVLVPLSVEDDELERAFAILGEAFAAVQAEGAAR
jgi:4-aminobutyrate aminotransferase/(S)-3-amino-2-methylpropionate transaminase